MSEKDNQNSRLSRNAVGENIDDDPLTPLIAAEPAALVRCPWLNDEVVTMSAAVKAYSENVALITADNIHYVASVMRGLEKVEEKDETEEKNDTEELEEEQATEVKEEPAEIKKDDKKSDDKNENPKAQEQLIKADIEPQVIKQIARNENLSQPAGQAEKSSVPQKSKLSVKARAAVSPAKGPDILADASTSGPEAPAVKSDRTEDHAAQIPPGQESESFVLPAVSEPAGENAEPLEFNARAAYVPEETDALEATRAAINGQPLALIDYPPDIDSPADFTEDEALIDPFREIALEPDESYMLAETPALESEDYDIGGAEELFPEPNIEIDFAAAPAAVSRERFIPDNLAIAQTEDALTELSDKLKVLAPEIIDEVNEILETIVEISMTMEPDGGETITKADAQTELEELFTELLNRMGIDYTPQLIESLARLSIDWRLAEQIEKLKQEEPDKPPRGAGTHEIIRKLLAALGAIKKAIARASTIGRSVLRLYSFSPAV